MAWAICALVSCGLTGFEVSRTFPYTPRSGKPRKAFIFWMLVFIVVNGLLSLVLFNYFKDLELLKKISDPMKGFLIGSAYLALIRLKFFTFKAEDADIPFGVEYFYNGAKDFFYKRLNSHSKTALVNDAKAMAAAKSLKELAQETRLSIQADGLLTDEERKEHLQWLLRTLGDAQASEDEKKETIALNLLTERKGT